MSNESEENKDTKNKGSRYPVIANPYTRLVISVTYTQAEEAEWSRTKITEMVDFRVESANFTVISLPILPPVR